MINFICYLFIFMFIVIFSKFNVLLLIYIILNLVLVVGWLVVYILNKKKYKQTIEKKSFDIQALVLLILVVICGFFDVIKISNLLFGFLYLCYLTYELVICMRKKDYAFNSLSIKYNRLFDIYSFIYLTMLLVKISSYQF